MTELPRRYDLALTALILAAAFWINWSRHYGGWGFDMGAVYFAARAYGLGEYALIYVSQPQFFEVAADPGKQALAAAWGLGDKPMLPYLYPPIWAALLAPAATALGPQAFFNVTLTLQIAALVAVVPLAWRIAGAAALPLWLWTALSAVLLTATHIPFFAMFLDQLQIVVTALMILAFERYKSGAPATAGAVLGLAAALKFTPILLGVIFLFDRNWRALGWTLGVSGGIAVLSLVVAGPALHLALIEQLGRMSDNLLVANINYGIEPVLMFLTNTAAVESTMTTDIPRSVTARLPWANHLAAGVLLAGLTALWWGMRRSRISLWGQIVVVVSLTALTGPLGWAHYLLAVFLLLPAVFGLLPRATAVTVTAVTLAAFSLQLFDLLSAPGQRVIWVAFLGSAWTLGILLLTLFARTRPDPAR